MAADLAPFLAHQFDNLVITFALDIEKLDVANFTNCCKWNSGEEVYLSFTRGKKEISNYSDALSAVLIMLQQENHPSI